LVIVASNKNIWEHYIFDGSDPLKISRELEKALTAKENGIQFPFVIINKQTNKIIGSTRFLDIQSEHKKLEIGWTWLAPEYWSSEINPECKLLLLTHCFENLNAVRVQFKTDENNIRSRKAIEKIGGKLEGIMRNDMIRENGTLRNSALYSILANEWNEVKILISELYLSVSRLKSNLC
jgi:RimJ/RimL family protein N-acetyltransferase